MTEELNSSLDSLELELYHRPNLKIKSILNYLREKNLRFCTDPKQKQEDYYSKQQYLNNKQQFAVPRNKYIMNRSNAPQITLVCEINQE